MARAGDIIYLARKARKYTQSDLAKVSGVGQPKISAYERHVMDPSYETVERLVGYCGMRMAVQLEEERFPLDWEVEDPYRLYEVQWRLIGFAAGLLAVHAVRPRSKTDRLLLLVQARKGGWFEVFQRHAKRSMPNVSVVDMDGLNARERREMRQVSVPLAFFQGGWRRRETRPFPQPDDDRWYGTRLPDVPLTALHGEQAAWDPDVWSRHTEAVRIGASLRKAKDGRAQARASHWNRLRHAQARKVE